MKLLPLKTSLLALALFAAATPGIAMAAGKAESGTLVVAQAEDGSAAGTDRIEAIRKFIKGGRNLSKLDDAKLQQRLKRAEKLKNTPDLPDDVAQGLDQEISEMNAELERRQSAGGQSSETQVSDSDSDSDSGAGDDGQSADEPAGSAQSSAKAPDSAASSSDVADFLSSVRPAGELDKKSLRAQMRKAAQLSKASGVSADDRQKLKQVVRDGRAALGKGKSNDNGTSGASANNTQVESGNAPASGSEADDGEVQQPAKKAASGEAAPASPKVVVDVASEQRARDILNDKSDARTMNKADLRKRLASMRDLLSANKLSPETNKALRQRLATERAFLRQEVGREAGGADKGTVQAETKGTGNNITINNDVTINQNVVKVVLKDQRPSADLKDDELRARINVYRKVVVDVNYSEPERLKWRTMMERDRVILRQRMLDARRDRAAKLKSGAKDIDINLSVEFKPGRPVAPRSVFAAEADDKELTDVLAAPPRRKLERKYTVEEVESDPQLRDAVARIEIDTVHFGFGEGFLREEEIDNLDRIAEIMEQILAVNPGEVFMIEGHTDAVGSDPSNLELSRERAKAVKQALTTYYVIPGENLKTVGFGERYLKIPTSEPEAENRRVSIARITALVGALDE